MAAGAISKRRFMLSAISVSLAGLAAAGRPAAARGLSPDLGASARAFADLAEREYHDGAVGAALARAVRDRLAAGGFDLSSPDALAAGLMDAALTVTGDKHFAVMAGMHHGMAPSIRPGARRLRPDPAWLGQMREDGFGVARVDVSAAGIGLIDIRRFYSPHTEVRRAVGEAMAQVADAKALVFDLTQNIGGDPAGVAFVSSHLFERAAFVVNRFRWRTSGVEEFSTTKDLAGPVFPESRLVFVATSASTFSAGEEFAYNLQALKRATIVGERTAGGANHAEMFEIGEDIVAFIPCASAENPVTGGNWEGEGVKPDTPAAAAEAVETAIRLATEAAVAL